MAIYSEKCIEFKKKRVQLFSSRQTFRVVMVLAGLETTLHVGWSFFYIIILSAERDTEQDPCQPLRLLS